jgi:hypothetical protein
LSTWFGAGHPSRSKRASIAIERAEILSLIRTLAAERSARPRGLSSKAFRVISKPPAATTVSLRPPPAATRLTERPASNGDDVRSATEAAALEGFDQRLKRVERALLDRSRPSSAPPPSERAALFSGLIRGQMLSDMLQLVSSNNYTGRFVVESDASKCTLYFDDGRICHAQAADLQGERAFFAAFGFEHGRYYFVETVELPEARTISAGTQFLILEALRQIDEAKPE